MTYPFSIQQAGEGVWGAVSPPLELPAISNAAIIDLGDRTVVVDSFMTPEAAEALVAAAEELTGKAPSLLVTTHHHGDHIGGNAVFAALPRVGTQTMRDLIESDVPLPDILIDGPIDVVGSDRRVSVVPLGSGHTKSDVIVYVPDVAVAVAGDLVWNGMHPKTSDGYPRDWYQSLQSLTETGAQTVITGHGDIGDTGLIDAMGAYMIELERMVDGVTRGDIAVDRVDPPNGSESWRDLDRFRAGLRAISERSD